MDVSKVLKVLAGAAVLTVVGCGEGGLSSSFHASSELSSPLAAISPGDDVTQDESGPQDDVPERGDVSEEDPCVNSYRAVTSSESESIQEVCRLTNLERGQQGAVALTLDPLLTEVAQKHAVDMYRRGYFDHTNPDGLDPFDRMRAAGSRYLVAGENIAQGQRTPSAVVLVWMGSSGHRSNILYSRFRKIGVGSHERYWVQVFSD